MASLIQEPASGATEIALERVLAERLGLQVGDTVRLGVAPDSLPRLAVVAAIYEPRPDPAELSRLGRRLRMHLPDLAALLDLLGARDGRRFLERQPGVGGVLVRDGGEPVFVGVLDVREVARA